MLEYQHNIYMSNELVGLQHLLSCGNLEKNDLNVESLTSNGHIKRGRTQKQPPSDAFFQNLGGVPFAAGSELEGVWCGWGAGSWQAAD